MTSIQFHDAIGGQTLGVLSVEYHAADPTITLAAALPAHIVAKGAPVSLKLDAQLFEATAFSVSNTVLTVDPDPQTADTTHIVGTPVYLELTSATMERFRDKPFVTDGDESADLPNSVDINTLTPTTLTIPSATAPAQTAEGSAVWDSNDDKLTVGTGAGRKTLVNDDDSRLTDDRDPTAHAASHEDGGSDEIEIADLGTAETDTTLVLSPNGTGGVEFRAETGGGGPSGGHWEVLMFGSAPPEPVTNQAEDDWLYIWIPDA